MARARIPGDEGTAAVRAALDGADARETLATAVRYLLQRLAEDSPGNTVEVRVPPFGAVQCIEGPKHTRGTPPNVVEVDAVTWVRLATGRLGWVEALDTAVVRASGARADLSARLPVLTDL